MLTKNASGMPAGAYATDHRFGAGFGLGLIMIASAAIWTGLALLVF